MTTQSRNDTTDTAALWARPFLRSLLDHWLGASVQPNGLFFPYLDQNWQRVPREKPLTLVSQCRLIYNFCRGWDVFSDARDAEAASQGLNALRQWFRLAPGRYRWTVSPQGAQVSAEPDAYGHAFVLLALATAARTLNAPALADEARKTWTAMQAMFGEPSGGLIWHPQRSRLAPRSQNPLMHTFEALMALQAVDGSGQAQAAAAEMLAFVRSLPDFTEGRLVEMFTPDWEPLALEDGGVLNLGHQFEWALLLSDWHAATDDQDALRQGERFLQTGLTWGLDRDGGIWESCGSAGQPVSRIKGLWQQCEAMRAIRRYALRHGSTDAAAAFPRTLHFYRQQFADPVQGGVFAQPEGLGAAPQWHKGDAWKLDYHSVNLCLELLHP